MKKRSEKMMALILAGCMSASLLAGCGGGTQESSGTQQEESSQESKQEESFQGGQADSEQADGAEGAEIDTSEHVVLTMYCIGDEGGIYAEEHLQKLNELLTEKINAEIDPIMVSWGDYKTKLPMVWASGEAYDLSFSGNWINYFQESDRGAYMELTELFPKYAPKTYAEMTEKNLLETTKSNGKLYMVPTDKPDYTTFVYNYREDLRKKYNCPEIVDVETLETFMDAIVENEPGMTAYGNNNVEGMWGSIWSNQIDRSRELAAGSGLCYDLKDPSKVFCDAFTDEYEEFVLKSREYYEKGYWSQSIMAETAASKDMFLAGKTAIYPGNFSNSNGVYQDVSANHPDWEIGVLSTDLLSGMTERVAAANNGMSIGAYSKNPERAMMFIELVYQDEEVYSVLMNGLEGVTFEKDEETRTKKIPDGIDPTTIALKNLGMGFGKVEFDLGSLSDSPLINELKEKYAEVEVFPGLAGFAINQENISAELAACKAVSDEMGFSLGKGVYEDPLAALEEYRQRLKDAGIDKVVEEVNKQVQEYLASQQ